MVVSDFLTHWRTRPGESTDHGLELFKKHESIKSEIETATAKTLPLLRPIYGEDGTLKVGFVESRSDEAKELCTLIDQHEGRLSAICSLITDFLEISGGEFECTHLQTEMQNYQGRISSAGHRTQLERKKFENHNPRASLAAMASDPAVAAAEEHLAISRADLEPKIAAIRERMIQINAIVDEAKAL